MFKKDYEMHVINLFCGPGGGKSTTAAGLFFLLKLEGINCESVSEFAKQATWAGRQAELNNQAYIFAKQLHKIHILEDKVDLVITDSPLILSTIYTPANYPKTFTPFVFDIYNTYQNINILIERTKPYNPSGRNQTEDESKQLDIDIEKMLLDNNLEYYKVRGDRLAPAIIKQHLIDKKIIATI